MKKIVGMASLPNRVEGLKDTIKCLSPQVDHIYVWLNGYKEIPNVTETNVTFHLSKENIGAVGKVKIREIIDKSNDFYFFTCDDDIIYPNNYIEHNIKNYTEGSFQSSHTGLYKSYPIVNYYIVHPREYIGSSLVLALTVFDPQPVDSSKCK